MPEQVVGQGQGLAGNGLGSPNVLVEQGQVAELLHDVDTVCLNVKFYPALDFRAKVGTGTECQVMTTYISDQTGGPGTGPGNPTPPTDPPAVGSGFTTFALHADAREIYVSESEGNDLNTGLTSSVPLKTLEIAQTKIRPGRGDHLLLKRGDTWDYNPNLLILRGLGGRDTTYPTYIGPYGASGAMPVVQQAFYIRPDDALGDSNYFAIQGVEFNMTYANRIAQAGSSKRNPIAITVTGVDVGPVEDVWIEGCTMIGYRYGISLLGVSNKTIRRNTILDMYSLESADGLNDAPHSQGIFIGKSSVGVGVGKLRVVENIFDQCGGFISGDNIVVDGVDSGVDALDKDSLRTWHMHALYHSQSDGSTNSDVTVTDNLVSRSGLAFQCRNGGTVQNNAFIVNAVHLEVGHDQQFRDNITATVDNNIYLGNEFAYTPGNVEAQRVQCILISKVNSATISNNIGADHGRSSPTANVVFAKAKNGVGTAPALTFTDNHTRNWDNQWLSGGPYYEQDSDSTYTESTSGGDFQDGTNTAATVFDVALAAYGGTYAGYYSTIRAENYYNWTADRAQAIYTAAGI